MKLYIVYQPDEEGRIWYYDWQEGCFTYPLRYYHLTDDYQNVLDMLFEYPFSRSKETTIDFNIIGE